LKKTSGRAVAKATALFWPGGNFMILLDLSYQMKENGNIRGERYH
jgi:hypothetical protein